MDACLYGKNHGVAPDVVAEMVELEPGQVKRVYQDIDAKRRTTRYQHMPPLLVTPVGEITR